MEQGAFGNILGLLRAQSGVDFTHYKQAILRGRIKRRMTTLRLQNPEEYESYLRANPPEIQSLLNDILVLMAGFFRLPAALKWFKKNHDAEPANKSGPAETHSELSDTKVIESKESESAKRRFRSHPGAMPIGVPDPVSTELKHASAF
ncbi:MAG TPA: hypothetical protein VGV18_04545, partial [Verrucomicrobiae bacterium]|nr:hypothetical protein [Verrucomicrobiae bacterium]